MLSDYQLIDLDTQQKIRYTSESSNTSTSGYSTVSQHVFGDGKSSPAHSLQSFHTSRPSPSQSPSAVLTTDLAALGTPLLNLNLHSSNMLLSNQNNTFNQISQHPVYNITIKPESIIKTEYTAKLVILEEPTEKFRFRYKSEMHGTHGSLNGVHSKKTPKTYPEVELRNFQGNGVIRCSLYQTDLDSPAPHSHQLVVRKDDQDICDPHDLYVSPEKGYIAQFQNMGIIHTAKKFIVDELLKKKLDRMKFLTAKDKLSMREQQEVKKQTEKEAKVMNLNQVRLCFEAFKIEDNGWTQIAEPVFSHPINNRKSAQTGELRICRLSSIVGSVSGGDDLILLVEKVSKKNIQVRFYEVNDDEEVTWEALGKFRESDVHHQYAIVVQTPPYKNKDIDKHVNVFIELVRPSDDERSDPVPFRYKPRDALLSRKRRRTCSTTNSSSSNSLTSSELPEPVAKTNENINKFTAQNPKKQQMDYQTISEEYDKDQHLRSLYNSEEFMEFIEKNSNELRDICQYDIEIDNLFNQSCSSNFTIPLNTDPITVGGAGGRLENDGCSSVSVSDKTMINLKALKTHRENLLMCKLIGQRVENHPTLQKIFDIFDNAYMQKNSEKLSMAAKQVRELFSVFSNKNENGDSLAHDVITNGNMKTVIKTYKIIEYLHLNDILLTSVNIAGENALHSACLHNKAEYIRPLLRLGCDPNLQDNQGNTPLHIAVRENHTQCVDSLLKTLQLNDVKSEQNIDLINDDGLTPLHMAIRADNLALTSKLLNYNAMSARIFNSKDGNNALHLAVLQQNLLLVRAILEKSTVNVNHPNRSGLSAIDLAKTIDLKYRREIVDMMLKFKDSIQYNTVVKEEPFEESESSTEDDEDMSSNYKESVIKEEESYCTEQQMDSKLKELLNNSEIFSNLVDTLSGEKWIQLAKQLKINHLICLWPTAAQMLAYIRDHLGLDYDTFNFALSKIDPIAASKFAKMQ